MKSHKDWCSTLSPISTETRPVDVHVKDMLITEEVPSKPIRENTFIYYYSGVNLKSTSLFATSKFYAGS